MAKLSSDGFTPSDSELFGDFKPLLRSQSDIESDLLDHRQMLEEFSGEAISEDLWQLYRSKIEASFSILSAVDIAPLEKDSITTEHLRKMPSWTLAETALLLTGINPLKLDIWLKNTPPKQRIFALPEHHTHVIKVLQSAADIGELRFPIAPRAIIKWWSRDTGRAIPAALKSWAHSRKKSNMDEENFKETALRVYEPGQTFKELLSHEELIEYGKRYTGKNTLRNWVKEAGVKLPKAGRPKKAPTS